MEETVPTIHTSWCNAISFLRKCIGVGDLAASAGGSRAN